MQRITIYSKKGFFKGNHLSLHTKMDRSKEKNSAILSVFKHYDRLSSSLSTSVILPYLQEHRLVPLPSERDGIDFYRSLAGEETEKRKAMALLTKVMECPKETWFDEFTNILSRIPDYKSIAEDLHAGRFVNLIKWKYAR